MKALVTVSTGPGVLGRNIDSMGTCVRRRPQLIVWYGLKVDFQLNKSAISNP